MRLSRGHLDTLFAHAANSSAEVCGILVGHTGPVTVVEAIVPARNVHAMPQRHFLLDAATLLRTDEAARATGQAIIGFYHSHPNGSALPSAEDRRLAWPKLMTLIIAVEQGQPRYLCAWRHTEYWHPEPIQTLAGATPPR